jgi:hypothetical protein
MWFLYVNVPTSAGVHVTYRETTADFLDNSLHGGGFRKLVFVRLGIYCFARAPETWAERLVVTIGQ